MLPRAALARELPRTQPLPERENACHPFRQRQPAFAVHHLRGRKSFSPPAARSMRSKISATSPPKFSIESRPPLLSAPVGSAILARQDTWPALKHLAMYSLKLQGIGMRQPHWHPARLPAPHRKSHRQRMAFPHFFRQPRRAGHRLHRSHTRLQRSYDRLSPRTHRRSSCPHSKTTCRSPHRLESKPRREIKNAGRKKSQNSHCFASHA